MDVEGRNDRMRMSYREETVGSAVNTGVIRWKLACLPTISVAGAGSNLRHPKLSPNERQAMIYEWLDPSLSLILTLFHV